MPLVHNSYLHRVITNQRRGIGATALRTTFRAAEFFYTAATAIRNTLYDANILRARHLKRRPHCVLGQASRTSLR